MDITAANTGKRDSGSKSYYFLIAFLGGITLVYVLVFCLSGDIHVDEAGYIYAAREVAHGRVPYHDFLYLQTPVFPYVMAIPFLFFDGDFLLVRSFMSLFALASIVLGFFIAQKLGGRIGGVMLLFFCAVSPFQLEFFTIARMYSLSTFFLCIAVFFLLAREESPFSVIVASICLTLAGGTRLTLAPGPIIFIGYLSWKYGVGDKRVIQSFAGWVLTQCFIFLPFALPDIHRFFYNIIGFHLQITLGSIKGAIIHKLAGLSRLVHAYQILIISLIALILVNRKWLVHRLQMSRKAEPKQSLFIFLAVYVLSIGLGHFSAKFFQESYQSPLFMYVVFFLIILAKPQIDALSLYHSKENMTLLFVLIALISITGHGFRGIARGDQLRSLDRARTEAAYVAQVVPQNGVVITASSPLLPLIGRRKIMVGFESIEYFPLWSRERCKYIHVVNQDMLKEIIREKKAAAVIVDDQSFLLRMPERTPSPKGFRAQIISLLEETYPVKRKFPDLFSRGKSVTVYSLQNQRLPKP